LTNHSYFISVPYFSLPEFPDDCFIVKNNSIFLRDILVSNKSNPHINWGGQYDPHYEHVKSPQYKMCCRAERRKIKKLADSKKYDEIFLIFRTNKIFLDGSNDHYVVGYYEIDQESIIDDVDYGEPILYAKEARFVKLNDAIKISDFLKKTNFYVVRFNSLTNGGIYYNYLKCWVESINNSKNYLVSYINETKRINRIFKMNEYQKGLYNECRECANQEICPLVKRIKDKKKLYHQLPVGIADMINNFYNNN